MKRLHFSAFLAARPSSSWRERLCPTPPLIRGHMPPSSVGILAVHTCGWQNCTLTVSKHVPPKLRPRLFFFLSVFHLATAALNNLTWCPNPWTQHKTQVPNNNTIKTCHQKVQPGGQKIRVILGCILSLWLVWAIWNSLNKNKPKNMFQRQTICAQSGL